MNCPACTIEARIGTSENPHPLPRVYHACVARVIGEDERRVLELLESMTSEVESLRQQNDELRSAVVNAALSPCVAGRA